MSEPTLTRLAEELRGRGGLLAGTVVAGEPEPGPRLGEKAAAGPRAAAHEREYALLVEAIYEGYLQHYFAGRVVIPDDPDLALLAGDRLYALGLAWLAELGDLDAVTALADVISLAAQAHAEDSPERAAAVWEAGVTTVGHGAAAEGAPRRGGDSAA